MLFRAGLGAALLLDQSRAVTVGDLLRARKMTPERFADYFMDFGAEILPYVQDPEVFLQTEKGCCQDYAILAGYVLSHRNYETHLIRVMLACGAAHDVCYVTQAKAYLDYNLRASSEATRRSGQRIREIATQVAEGFDENWTSASEFTYAYSEGRKRLTLTVVKTDPPTEDADTESSAAP